MESVVVGFPLLLNTHRKGEDDDDDDDRVETMISEISAPTIVSNLKHQVTTKTKKKKTNASIKVVVSSNDAATTKQQQQQQQQHMATSLPSSNPNYRIQRELKSFMQDPPPNLTVSVGKNIRVWIITMQGANNTVYDGETFRLRIQFPLQYPTVPPSVYFVGPNIPLHEHVYSNGDICLSLLGKDWRPTMTAQSIAVSILSILSSAQSKTLPMDNAQHAQNKPGQYQKDWVYHDDNC
jgi:ubiquitin-conjugating enzyme E2 W